ncbi:MAG: hypothetical protein ACR2GR_09360 [Rhodothermales bacterium]
MIKRTGGQTSWAGARLDIRTAWVALVVGALVVVAGCGLLGEDQQAFEVHLQSTFKQDHVRVEIDGHVVFDGRVTSDPLVGGAEVIKLERPTGMRRIRVTVNDSEVAEERFKLEERLTVAVQYYAEAGAQRNALQGVIIDVFKGSLGYD